MITGFVLFWGLFNNLAIFILLVAGYGFLFKKLLNAGYIKRQITLGFFFGIFAIACMNAKIPVAPGVIVDQRNTIIVLSGIFGGPLSVVISAIIAGIYRFSLGGSGVFSGIIGLSLSAAGGVAIHYSRSRINTVYGMALAAFLASLLILPGFLFIGEIQDGWLLLKKMILPYGSAIYLGIFFVGFLLSNEEKRIHSYLSQVVSEQRYRKLFEDLIDISFHTDVSGNITLISPSVRNLLGYEAEEVLGKNIAVFYKSFSTNLNILSEIRIHGILENFETELKRKDGTQVWVSTNAKILKNAEGESIGIEGITRDISKMKDSEDENKRLQDQLLHKSKMDTIGQLTGSIAHDFNNILTIILGTSQLLRLTDNDTQKNRLHYVDMIIQASKRGADLTEKLLSYARKDEIIYTLTDLHSLIKETESLLKHTIRNNISVLSSLNAPDHCILSDTSGLQNVILNLFINASNAISDRGKIQIKTRNISFDQNDCDSSSFLIEPGEFVEITISDSGCGIPPENLEKIFEPFYTTKKTGEGTGLGLATVRRYVHDSKGAIHVESTIERGTSFYMYFPCAGNDGNQSAIEEETSLDFIADL